MPKTTDKKTEDKILAAATEVFLVKGYTGARMQEIADRAEINKAMLHYYFRSKEKLFRVILTRAMDTMEPILLSSLGGEEGVLEKVEILVTKQLEFFLKNPHMPLFVMYELSQNQGQFMREVAAKRATKPIVAKFIQQVVEESLAGKIRAINPLHLMMNVMSMIIFPFVAKPMICTVAGVEDGAFVGLLEERREAIISFVRASLRP